MCLYIKFYILKNYFLANANGECYTNANNVMENLWDSSSSSWRRDWSGVTHESCEANCVGFTVKPLPTRQLVMA